MAALTPEQKETWAGVRRAGATPESEVATEKEKLEQNLDWSTYQDAVTGSTVTSYSEHSTYLQNNASFSSAEASTLNNKAQNQLTDQDSSGTTWDEYETEVSNFSSWEQWANLFDTQTSFGGGGDSQGGGDMGGIRVFDSSGYTHDGVQVPAGSVEVFGRELHFSQKEPKVTSSPDFSWSNLQVSDQTPEVGQTITISADVTNNGSHGHADASLFEDGSLFVTKSVEVPSGSTVTVEFDRTYPELGSFDVAVDGLSTMNVTVVPQPPPGV